MPQEFEVYGAHKCLTAEHGVAIKLVFSGSGDQTTENVNYFCGSKQIQDVIFKKQQPGSAERSRYFQATEEMSVNGWQAR